MLGFIPHFLHTKDRRPAREQFDERYVGGWHPFEGFKRTGNFDLQYPEDPPTRALARTELRDEIIVFYDGSWVAIFQKDGTFEVARLD